MSNGADWLVKAGGLIIGPLTDREVTDKLKSREIRVIDEISKPCGRWIYLRDEPQFAKVVEEVRMGNSRMSDDTVTNATEDGTRTPTNTVTLTDATELDDLTEEITQSAVQEAMYQSFDDINKGGNDRRSESSASPLESFTYDGDKAIHAKAQASTKWVAGITILLVGITIVYVIFNQFIAQPIEDKNIAEESRGIAAEALRIGNYDNALSNFRIAYEADPDDRSVYPQLGVLEIQVGNQSVVGKRLLEKVRNWVGAEKKHVFTGLGLAALKDGDYESANKHFDEALAADPLFLPAVINLGVTALYLNEHQKANNFFQLALKDGSRDGIDLLLLVDTLYKLYQTEQDRSYLVEAKRYLDGMRKVSRSYLDEVYVASAFIEVHLENTNKASEHMAAFLERPLGESSFYKHDVMVHRDQVSWDKINQWCLEATSKLDPSSHNIAAEAKCLFMSKDLLGASQKIDTAVNQTPRDSLVQAVYAELLRGIDLNDKAKAATDTAWDLNKEQGHVLPLILQARYCESQKDYFCSLNYWQEVLKKNPKSEMAMAGIGRSYFEDGHYSDAKKYLAMAKRLRTNYKPVLKLDRDIQRTETDRGF